MWVDDEAFGYLKSICFFFIYFVDYILSQALGGLTHHRLVVELRSLLWANHKKNENLAADSSLLYLHWLLPPIQFVRKLIKNWSHSSFLKKVFGTVKQL